MKRRPRHDSRPDWRDPNLPCIRDYRMGDGTHKTEVDPDYERRYREHLMQTSSHPSYRDDPTYNLKRKP
jgi:hypothetical protein